MNLRQMEVFRAVMLTGAVGRAAEFLHVSQPAVSKVLASAEERTGLRLFDRVKGRLIPTEDAKRLYSEVAHLWEKVEKIRMLSHDLANPVSRRLSVVTSPSLGVSLLPRLIADLQAQEPDLLTRVDFHVGGDLDQSVLDQNADLAVTSLPIDHPNVSTLARYECALVCVMHADHPLAGKRVIAPADLIGHKLIEFPHTLFYGLSQAQVYEKALDRLDVSVEVHASHSACWFASAGTGVAVVDALTLAGDAFPGLVVKPYKVAAKVKVQIVHSMFCPPSRAGLSFVSAFDKRWKTMVKAGKPG